MFSCLIAIEAIKNAHRLELERELRKRRLSDYSSGNTDLRDVCRQHGYVQSQCCASVDVAVHLTHVVVFDKRGGGLLPEGT